MGTEALAAAAGPAPASSRSGATIGRIAWRNLWRNRRRTWLTAGGIGFAVWLLIVAMSMQDGTFEIMVDNGARLAIGHAQIQHPEYQDDPRLEFTLENSTALRTLVESIEGVVVASERAQSFALASFGERSFGAQIIGVDAAREARWSSLPGSVIRGRYIEGPGEAFIGATLARNLAASVGDSIVLLGTAKEGGVAAAVAQVVGTFTSGQAELDRAVVQIGIEDFRAAWNLRSDEAHSLMIIAGSVAQSESVVEQLKRQGVPGRVLGWRDLMAEAVQTIDLKQIGTILMFCLIAIIVTFSIVNSFMMTVFERTPEFGMLMAIGMKPGRIMGQLSLEALLLAIVGISAGMAASAALLIPLAQFGMPLPESAAEILNKFNIPDRMYPRFSSGAAFASGIIMLLGTQIAALIPALRIRRMRPVEALRARE